MQKNFTAIRMAVLTKKQQDAFWENGFLVLPDAVSSRQLGALQDQFASWVNESRSHSTAYGECIDGKPRFHVEAGHNASQPALLRVNAPVEVSDAYLDVMKNSRMTQAVVDLVGPDVKFHHSKINSKLPGGHTAVKWHQDFPFTPHSNDSVITALLMVDDVTDTNGPLRVRAGSHTGDIHTLWHNDRFTGAVADELARDCEAAAVQCEGTAGSVCLMHTRLLHGSSANHSSLPRTLFICVYSADDALPLSPNPMPSRFEGLLISGTRKNRVRATDFALDLPQLPVTGSFFDQQAG